MRKILLTAAALLMAMTAFVNADAMPAYPKSVDVRQADGTYITVRSYGDEFYHYRTTSDGYPVVEVKGIYYHANVSNDGKLVSTGVRAHNPGSRTSDEQSMLSFKAKGVSSQIAKNARMTLLQNSKNKMKLLSGNMNSDFPTTGEVKSLVILVEFSDVSFRLDNPNQKFTDLLNQEGYSENGATGSARDYYLDNSYDSFQPEFVVVGPVKLDQTCEYYGNNDSGSDAYGAAEMIADACRKAHDEGLVNFSEYDYNHDGKVDNVFVFFAGVNEAEHGSEDTIWPHRWVLQENLVLDGVTIYDYACTSELKGSNPYDMIMAGIGNFTHEFAHVLGLPDFYDTDNASSGGTTDGVYNYSLLGIGSYNNESRTPPYLSATERYLLGWLEPEVLEYTGEYALSPIQEDNKAYMLETGNEGEFFMLENRQNEGWDAYLPGRGLMIFHVDRSQNIVNGYPALNKWSFYEANGNSVNNNPEHMCYRIVSSLAGANSASTSFMPYPGDGGFTEFSKTSNPANTAWSGENIDAELFSIREEGNMVYFSAKTSKEKPVELEGIELSADRTELIINDTLKMNVLFTPWNTTERELTWSSSNSSVAAVDTAGVVTGLSTGSATITAKSADGSISADFSLNVASGQLVRGKLTDSRSANVVGAEVTITIDGSNYTATSDRTGMVSFEDIPAGSGTVTIVSDAYPEQSKAINVIENASLFEYRVLNDDELKMGYYPIELNVEPYESSAYVTWESTNPAVKKWIVKWYEANNTSSVETAETEEPKFDVTGLKQETYYYVVVSEMTEIIEGDSGRVSFVTTKSAGSLSRIVIDRSYAKGETLLLKASNLPEGAEISWTIDDAPYASTELVLNNPEYKIELTIKTADNTEIITKYLKVE